MVMVGSKKHFALQNSFWHLKGFLRTLWAIWARALDNVGQPCFTTNFTPQCHAGKLCISA